MTRVLHVTAGFIIWLLFTAIGGALVYANGLKVETGLLGVFYQPGSIIQAMGYGGVMLLLALLYLVTLAPRRQPMRYISFDSEGGNVSISNGAVRDFIRKVGEEFGAVISMEPRLRADKNLISIDLDVKIQAGTRIPELSQMLQERVRESIRDGLGIAEVREIKVRIQEIVGSPPPSRSRA
jgi:uncharacterized alkaline shock family protein YloU